MAFGLPDPQALNQTVHRRQYSDFKVVVYRLAVPDPANITVPGVGTFNINDVLSLDFNSVVYQDMSGKLNALAGEDKAVFVPFLDAMHEELQSVIAPGGKVLDTETLAKQGVFVEMDITPIVQGVATQMSLEGINYCTISCVDPYMSTFGEIERRRFASESSLPSPSYLGLPTTEQLKSFSFREFDLVRVFAISSMDKNLRDRSAEISRRLTAKGMPAASASRFVMRPIFTGFVSQIGTSNAAGSVSGIEVSCAGVQRTLSQSTTVFSEALANVIAQASPEMGILKDTYSQFANNFTGMNADEIVRKIFNDYFRPSFLVTESSVNRIESIPDGIRSPDLKPDVSVAIPSVSNLLNALYIQDESGALPNLIPMLPAVLLLHLLKTKYREPILTIDDRILGPTEHAPEVGDSPATETVVSRDAGSLPAILKPYLDMAKDSFGTFDASYASASEVFDTIRQTTFMEIFEDKTGQFHFRFPRYNHSTVFHDIQLQDTISVSTSRDDSSVYTANVSQPAIPFINATGLMDGKVYIDKLSILRYGLRKPQTVENPHSVSPRYAAVLSKFMRDYKAGRESRTAKLEIVGRTSLEVGSMVIFRVGRLQRQGGQIETARKKEIPENAVRTMVGYVVGLSDRFSVSDRYTQSLDLAFVREASSWTTNKASATIGARIWDMIDLDMLDISSRLGAAEDGFGESSVSKPIGIRALGFSGQATGSPTDFSLLPAQVPTRQTQKTHEKYLPTMFVGDKSLAIASFRWIASAEELAEAANDPQVAQDNADYGALLKKKPGAKAKLRKQDILAQMKATAAIINDRLIELAGWQRTARIMQDFSKDVKQFVKTVNRIGPRPSRRTLQGLAAELEAKLDAINKGYSKNPNETISITVKGQKKTYQVPLKELQRKAATMAFDTMIEAASAYVQAKEARVGRSPFVESWTLIFRSPATTDSVTPAVYKLAKEVAQNFDAGLSGAIQNRLKTVAADKKVDEKFKDWDTWNIHLEDASQDTGPAVAPAEVSPLAGIGAIELPDAPSVVQGLPGETPSTQ